MARRWRNWILALTAFAGALALSAPAGAQVYSPGYLFLKSIKDGDGDKMVELIQKNSATIVNAQDITNGESALHLLVRKHNFTWMQYLVQQGANVNIEDKKGVTPLVLASQTGWLEGVEYLIEAHAKVDVPNSTGETPLIAAVHRRDTTMIRVLLIGGADPDRADSSGRSARDYATLDGANNPVLAEIQKNEKPKAQRQGAKTYGPSL